MCGIVGYVGPRDAAAVVLDGLKRLEYRGYDSAGIVTIDPGGLVAVKRAGKLTVLTDALADTPLADTSLAGRSALGHTRWATHGRPTDANAHPHLSEDGRLAIVHNGIIENHAALRERLREAGHRFDSETDSEVLVHLIEEHYGGDLEAAVRAALGEVEGAYALVVAHSGHPEIIAARATSPLVIGLGEDETIIASDVPALLPYTRTVMFLRDGEMAVVRPDVVEVSELDHADSVAARGGGVGRRGGREGRLAALHAEGDLRAARRSARHLRRTVQQRGRRRGAGSRKTSIRPR